jgi:hypothetical protein
MAREDDVAAVMAADGALMAILTGGVYTAAGAGPLGVTRETTPGAFDADGYLRPAALVRQRGQTPDGVIDDQETQQASAARVVEVWLYEDSGYTNIDAAGERLFRLLHGRKLTGTLPLEWAGGVDRQRDNAALMGAAWRARIGL